MCAVAIAGLRATRLGPVEAVRQHKGRKSYLLGARDMCHDVQDVYDRRSPYVRNILNDGRLWDEVAQSFNHDLNENESDKMKMKANKRHVPVGARTRVPMPWLPDNETLMQARTLKELAAGPTFSGVSEALPPLELGQLPVCPILQSIIHISCICCSAAAGSTPAATAWPSSPYLQPYPKYNWYKRYP